MDKWYVARGDATKGPFTIAQLRSFVEKGQLRATDLLRREGSEDWVAAGTFSVFFPTPDAHVPPPVAKPVTKEPKATPNAEVSRTAASESSPAGIALAKVEKPVAASKSRGKPKPKPLWIVGGAVGVSLLFIAGVMFLASGPESEADVAATNRSTSSLAGSGHAALDSGAKPVDATAAPAEEAQRSPFDWLKLTETGDVTQEILPYFRNGELNLGTAKIATGDAGKLVKAEIEAGKLLLTFQMNRPQQRVRFEGMHGALGTYRPNRERMRPVSIRGASHEERFALAGVLQIGVSHPHPEKLRVASAKPPTPIETFREAEKMMREVREKEAAEQARRRAEEQVAQKSKQKSTPTPAKKPEDLLPGPETGYKPRSAEFARLAAAVSAMYKMPGRDTFRPPNRAKMEAARAAAGYPDPKLQQYASKMLERVKADQSIDVPAVRQQLLARADQLARKTLDYGSVKGTYTDSDGSTKTVFASGNEPDVAAQAEARELETLARSSDDAIREYVKQQRNQNTFSDLFLGDGISNRLEDLYQNILIDSYKLLREDAKKVAGPESATCLITMLRADASTAKLRNVSGKKLTDVVVDLSWGFTRSEKLKTYGHDQFVFIPVWKPNEEVELQKIQLREPSVMHARVNVYATEAQSEDHAFALVDPGSPPNNKPGTLVFSERRGFASLGKPRYAGVAWAEVDEKRVDWKEVARPLEVTVEPGEHKVIVRAKDKGGKTRNVFDATLRVDGEEQRQIEVNFEQQ